MQLAFQKKCVVYLRHEIASSHRTVTSDTIGQMVEASIFWPSVIALIERNAAHFETAPIVDVERKQQFVNRYVGIVLACIPNIKRALSSGVALYGEGALITPYVLKEDEMNAAHEKFVMHLQRIHEVPDQSFWGGPRANTADLAGEAGVRKRRFEEEEIALKVQKLEL